MQLGTFFDVRKVISPLLALMLCGLCVESSTRPARAVTADDSGVRDYLDNVVLARSSAKDDLIMQADGSIVRRFGDHTELVGMTIPKKDQVRSDGIGTTLSVDSDRDKIVDVLETMMARNPSVAREVIIVKSTSDGDTIDVGSLNRSEVETVVRKSDVLAVWPDLNVAVPEKPSVTRVKFSPLPWGVVQPEDAVRGLAELRMSQHVDGSGVDIAVIDTGVDARHVGLAGRVAYRRNFVTDDSSCGGRDVGANDGNGHGTHVAAIAAGGGDVRGVAPGARIVGLRVLSCNGSGSTSDIIDAINWVIDHKSDTSLGLNIKVANLSLGAFACWTVFDGTDPMSVAVNRLVASGVATYVAAGNDAGRCGILGTVGIPGAAKFATTIGASLPESVGGASLAMFSSRGLFGQSVIKPDLVAPGANIVSARADTSDLDQSKAVSGTLVESGTSMATPFVSGVAALALQRDPSLAPSGSTCSVDVCPTGVADESMSLPLRDVEHRTARDRGASGPDFSWGWGLIEPAQVLSASGSAYPPSSAIAVQTTSTTTHVTARIQVAEEAPLSVMIEPQAARLDSDSVANQLKAALLRSATLTRVSDGVRIPVWADYFAGNDSLYQTSIPIFWHTGTQSLAPGLYDLDVRTGGYDGTVIVDASNASAVHDTNRFVQLAADKSTARPGANPTIVTLTNNLSEQATIRVVDATGTAIIVPASVTLAPGATGSLTVATTADNQVSAVKLHAEVVDAASLANRGIRSLPLILAVRSGLGVGGTDSLPRVERLTQNADGTQSVQPVRYFIHPGEGAVASADGMRAAFYSDAPVTTTDGTSPSNVGNVYLRDRRAATTSLVGGVANSGSSSRLWDVSSDGTHVLFTTTAALDTRDLNATADLYVWNVASGISTLVSRPSGPGVYVRSIGDFYDLPASFSPDGSMVAWQSVSRYTEDAPAFPSGSTDPNDRFTVNVYVTPVSGGDTRLLSVPPRGWTRPNNVIYFATIQWSSSGRFVVFRTTEADLVGAKSNRLFLVIADTETGTMSSAIPDPDTNNVSPDWRQFTVAGDRVVAPVALADKDGYGAIWVAPIANPNDGWVVDSPLGIYGDIAGWGGGNSVMVAQRYALSDDPGWCGLLDIVTGASATMVSEDGESFTSNDCVGGNTSRASGQFATVFSQSQLTVVDDDNVSDNYVVLLPARQSLVKPEVGLTVRQKTRPGVGLDAVVTAAGLDGTVTFAIEDSRIAAAIGANRPDWLTIDAGTGELAGVPPAPGTYTFVVRADDQSGRRAQAVFSLEVVGATLTVSTSGYLGSGTVTSSPSGIDCGSSCSATFDHGASVTLIATPAPGSSFTGWSGDCSGVMMTCTVLMTQARSVSASFGVGTHALSVAKSGTGSGSVTASTGGLSCGSACSSTYYHGMSVTLTAAAATGSSFTGWLGACRGTVSSCTLSMTQAQSVTATFALRKFALTIRRAGTGTVKSTPSGVNCGRTCVVALNHNTKVTLTATPAMGWRFIAWSGACNGKSSRCVVTMTAARTVTATFGKK